MIFRQLFNPADSAMTYLIGDPVSGEAVVIDPLKYQATLIRALLAEHHLRLKYVLRTHVHAPNRVDCGDLCPHTGAHFVIGRHNDPTLAGDRVADGDVLRFGDESIAVIETPGHTPGCVTYHWRDRIFCGDVLELGGWRQAGEGNPPGLMCERRRQRIYILPGETLVFPGHDYAGRTVSTVAEERQRNAAFTGLARDRFIEHMAHLEKRPVLAPDTDPPDQAPVI